MDALLVLVRDTKRNSMLRCLFDVRQISANTNGPIERIAYSHERSPFTFNKQGLKFFAGTNI